METAQWLGQMKLFQDMLEPDRVRWAERFDQKSYPEGEVVVRQNDRATAFYVVVRGELCAHTRDDGQYLLLDYFHEFDYFGETGLLTGEPRNATIDVTVDAELLVLKKQDFDQLMAEVPAIRERLLSFSRLREAAGRTHFPWQQPDEVTRFFSKKHWIALLRALRLTFLIALLAVLSTAVRLSSIGRDLSLAVVSILTVIAGVLLGFSVFLAIYHFLDWRNDQYIITDQRVVHIERVLLLREERAEAPLERVQDVQVNQIGFLANALEFGDVVIQTAAATERIVFAYVANPDYVHEALFAPMQYRRTRSTGQEFVAIRQELGRQLGIPVESPQAETEADQEEKEPVSPGEEQVQESQEVVFGLLGLLQHGWQRLRDLFTFETWLDSDEGKTITWRKNGWLLFGASMPPLFAAIFVVGLALLVSAKGIGPSLLPLLLLLLLVPIFGWWFYVYWDWQNDIYQISGDRLVDLKKRPLFLEESRRETTLERVQNVSLSIPSPIAQLLNYGTVVIETAGEIGAFEFEFVHNPRGVQEEIFKRLRAFKRKQQEEQHQQRAKELGTWFKAYDELKRGVGTASATAEGVSRE